MSMIYPACMPAGSISVPQFRKTMEQIRGYRKTYEAFISQCSQGKLTQFFKCSRSTCDFTCDDQESFYCHLLTHNENEEQDCCIYCERAFVIETLPKHMIAQHGKRKFQCIYCFYRGCTRAHLVIHSMEVHGGLNARGLICFTMREALMPDVRPRARTLVYRCSGCDFRAFNRDEFSTHIREEHVDLKTFKCAYCETNIAAEDFVEHFENVHGFDDLTCLYCGATYSQYEEILSHMTNHHSDWPVTLLDRRVLKRNCDVENFEAGETSETDTSEES